MEGFTADHLPAFKQHHIERVLIAYDRDEAGDRAAEKLAQQLLAEGLDCYRILFPKGMDANEYALKVVPASKSLGLAIAGFGDTLSFGLTGLIRNGFGIGSVYKCSGHYDGGQRAGIGLSFAFGGDHVGRNALNKMQKVGGLARRVERLISDPRTWKSVQATWSEAVGGYEGEFELHHRFSPQSAGGSNAAGIICQFPERSTT